MTAILAVLYIVTLINPCANSVYTESQSQLIEISDVTPAHDMLIMKNGSVGAQSTTSGTSPSESSQALCDLMNEFMRKYEESHDIISSRWDPAIIPGGKVVYLTEPTGSHYANGEVFYSADKKGEAYLWALVNGKWQYSLLPKVDTIYEVSSRGYLLVVNHGNNAFSLYDARTGQSCEYDAKQFGELCVSNNNTFISFTRDETIYGTIDDLNLKVAGILQASRHDMVDDWRQANTYVGWHCQGNIAVFGDGWILDIQEGTLKQASRDWSVPVGVSFDGRCLVRRPFGGGRQYAVLDIDCEDTDSVEFHPLAFPENQSVWSYDLTAGYSVQKVRSWFPGGSPQYNVRSIANGDMTSAVLNARFVGFLSN